MRGSAHGYTTSNAGDDWRHSSACRDEDPELFFPISRGESAKGQVEQAKAVCRRCLVKAKCLDWALESGQPEGIAGAMTPKERSAEKRKRAKAVAA